MGKTSLSIWTSDAYAAREKIPAELRDLLTPEDDLYEVIASVELLAAAGLDVTKPDVFALAIEGARSKYADPPPVTDESRVIWYPTGELARRRERTSVVYYARIGNRVKIGYTIDPARRMQTIHAEQLMATEPGGPKLEAQRHREFAHLRTHGEWFRLEEPLLGHITALA